MKSFIKFNKGMLRLPWVWQAWVAMLVVANVAPVFFLEQQESKIILGTLGTSMVLMVLLTSRFGFSRIIGVGHFVWIPMLAYLFTKLDGIPTNETFGIVVRAVILLNGISLLIDAVDAIRYIAGERAEMVEGL